MTSEKSTGLKVLEAYVRDVGRGVVRMDYDSMDEVGVETNSFVTIEGKKTTIAKVLPLYPSDEGRGICRIDGTIRANAGLSVNDLVTMRAVRPSIATYILAEVVDSTPFIDAQYLTAALEGIAIARNDYISIPYFGGRLSYKVKSWEPGVAAFVVVDKATQFEIGTQQSDEKRRKADLPRYRIVTGESEMNELAKDYVPIKFLLSENGPFGPSVIIVMEKR